jgi:hypothetical protein
MPQEPISLVGRSSLTRISVSGNGSHYVVRAGGDDPVRVWVGRGGLHCECGQGACAHITALEMCGFIEPQLERREAA